MKTKLLILIGIVVTMVITSSLYVMHFQTQCESLLGDRHYPRPLTFWNCMEFMNMIQENTEPVMKSIDSDPKKIPQPEPEREPIPKPEPLSDPESLQQQKQQQAKLSVQKVVIQDTRVHDHKLDVIRDYRDEFESGYFLEQFIIINKQNFEKDNVMHFIYGEWGFQPTKDTPSQVTVYFRSYENYNHIEKINEWQKPIDSVFLIYPDYDGYLMVDLHGMFPAIGHETCVIPGEYRVLASNPDDKSKVEWGYFTCQRDKLVGEPQPWVDLPE